MNNLKILLITTLLVTTGCGITASRHSAGFADFDSLGFLDVDRRASISIGPGLLRFAARHIEDDPETERLLRHLDGVRIKVYEINGDESRVAMRMDAMQQRLAEDHWQQVIRVTEGEERVHMMVMEDGDLINGLVFLVMDDNEAVLINIIGDLQPEMFAPVMSSLDVALPDIAYSSL